MKINRAGIDLIKRFEGFNHRPYKCPAGLMTIGYGHVIKPSESFSAITKEEAQNILEQDIKLFESQVFSIVKSQINENQFSALVSFSYNTGINSFKKSTLLKKVNYGLHLDVPDEFINWVYVDSKKFKGLMRRRLEEARLYMEY
jgi:lysozyme